MQRCYAEPGTTRRWTCTVGGPQTRRVTCAAPADTPAAAPKTPARTPAPRALPWAAALAAAAVAVVWGVNFVVIDLGIGDIPPTLFVALRFVAVLVPAIFLVPRPAARAHDVALVGALMSLGQFGLLYTALALGMPAGIASLVLQAQVVLTVLAAAVALRERPTRAQALGVGIGVAGLVTVAVGRGAATPATGLVLTLAAALSWALGNVVSRRVGAAAARVSSPDAEPCPTPRRAPARRPTGPLAGLSLTVWSALVVPVPLLGLALLTDGPGAVGHALTHLPPAALASTAYTAWGASLFGYGVWNTLLARYPAAAVAPWTMLVPPTGILAGWLVLGERPAPAELAGGAVLLLGVAVTTGALRPPGGRRPGQGAASGTAPHAGRDPQPATARAPEPVAAPPTRGAA